MPLLNEGCISGFSDGSLVILRFLFDISEEILKLTPILLDGSDLALVKLKNDPHHSLHMLQEAID